MRSLTKPLCAPCDQSPQGYGAFNCKHENSHYAGDPYDVESLVMEIGTFVLMAVVRLGCNRKMALSTWFFNRKMALSTCTYRKPANCVMFLGP